MQSAETAIDAVVGVGICGNAVIEADENCEGTNMGGATCTNLGWGGGTLSCDVACSFDTSMCTGPLLLRSGTPAGAFPKTSTNTPRIAPDPPASPQQFFGTRSEGISLSPRSLPAFSALSRAPREISAEDQGAPASETTGAVAAAVPDATQFDDKRLDQITSTTILVSFLALLFVGRFWLFRLGLFKKI